jgi:hypothetical protein
MASAGLSRIAKRSFGKRFLESMSPEVCSGFGKKTCANKEPATRRVNPFSRGAL